MGGDLAEQLLRLIDVRLLDPLEILLSDEHAVAGLRTRLRQRAAEWAATIESGPRAEAVHAVARIMATLHPDEHAFAPPAEWWRTPLGQAVVRLVGHPFAETVSLATAGAMLGISRQGVHDLVRRGRLPRHEDGGVPVSAVRERLLRADPAPPPRSPRPDCDPASAARPDPASLGPSSRPGSGSASDARPPRPGSGSASDARPPRPGCEPVSSARPPHHSPTEEPA